MKYQEWKTNELAGEGGFSFAEGEPTRGAYNAGLEHAAQLAMDHAYSEVAKNFNTESYEIACMNAAATIRNEIAE